MKVQGLATKNAPPTTNELAQLNPLPTDAHAHGRPAPPVTASPPRQSRPARLCGMQAPHELVQQSNAAGAGPHTGLVNDKKTSGDGKPAECYEMERRQSILR